ncbi:MAG: hypothetical protein ACT4RN_06040 [Pseudonocardia sp.]
MPAAPAPPPDRYADAVCARRAELRAARDVLAGLRAELRTALALARLGTTDELAAALDRLGREAGAHLDRGGHRERVRFPSMLLGAVEDLRGWAAERRHAAVGSAVARVAARRGIAVTPVRPAVSAPFAAPDAAARPPAWTGIAGGWRTALLPAAALPLLGLPVVTPNAVLGATCLGTAAAVLVAGRHHAAADRVRLRRWCEAVLAAVRTDADALLARSLLRAEQAGGAELDARVGRRRIAIEAELARLTPGSDVAVPRVEVVVDA